MRVRSAALHVRVHAQHQRCGEELGGIRLLFLTSVVWGTVLAGFGGLSVLGKSAAGYVWVVQALLGVLAVAMCDRRANHFPMFIWLPWIAWIAVRCDLGEADAVQRTMMLATPLIIGWCAGSVVTDRKHLTYLIDSFRPVTICIGLMWIASILVRPWPFGLRYQTEAVAMTLILGASYFAIGLYTEGWRALPYYVLCPVMCAITGLRGSTIVCLLAACIVPVLGRRQRRLRINVICMIVALGGVLVTLPAIHDKMFKPDSVISGVSDISTNLNTSGRFHAWEMYWEGIVRRPVFGHGGDAVGRFGRYNIMDETQWHHPHNEYIRVLFDYGLIGLVLLGIGVGTLLYNIWQKLSKSQDPLIRRALATAFTTMILACLAGITDNALLNIHFYGNWLFAIVGGSLSLSSAGMGGHR